MKITSKFAKLKAFVENQPGTPTWQVQTETTFPTFSGQVIQEEIENKHGGYTTEELFKTEYFFDGFIEAGYSIISFEKESDEFSGLLYVRLKNGPINILVTLTQYA
mgnify:CR=1 FL=1